MDEFDNSETSICPHCGYDQNTKKKEAYLLDPGYILNNRYIIGVLLGAGGFGATYVAWDAVLNKKVAVKEYFPSEFATRIMGTTEVCAYDGEKSYQYEAGLASFIGEAKRLAKFNSQANIVHIYDSFEANSTAYIIMDYVEGKTLKELLKERGPLPYEEVVKYAILILNALQNVHNEGIIHRDIAPDNIKINGDDAVLLDFGAARNATTHNSKSLSVIVKPGYAPQEQYISRGDQGPWTDVYAMGAVMYHLITGKLPPESIERVVKDEIKTPTQLGFNIPEPIENAIMNSLNVKPEHRIQTAKEFADALSGAVEMERIVVKTNDDNGKLSKKAKIIISCVAVVAVALIIGIIVSTTSINGESNHTSQELQNYVGVDKDTAIDEMEKENINYKIIGTEELEGVDEGEEVIAYQNYEPGTPVDDVNELSIKIQKAPVKKGEVPDLTSLTKEKAIERLKKAGFENYTFKEKNNNQYDEGLVCEQSVKANKKASVDTEIIVYLAKNTTTTTKKQSTTNSSNSNSGKSSNTTTKRSTAKQSTTSGYFDSEDEYFSSEGEHPAASGSFDSDDSGSGDFDY
jgi:serine/threonine protein kinase